MDNLIVIDREIEIGCKRERERERNRFHNHFKFKLHKLEKIWNKLFL